MDLKIDSINVDVYQLEVIALQSYYSVYQHEYIKDDSLIERPSWANERYACKNLIWLNKELGEIGFIGVSACRVLKLAEIDHLEITNILPAKGPGSTELVAVLNSTNTGFQKKDIFFERGAYFDPHEVEMIRLFSNLNILIFANSYDC